MAENRLVRDCRTCNFYLCGVCTPFTECPQKHRLFTAEAPGGRCSGCNERVSQGKLVMKCSACDWVLCKYCQPLTQCPAGHELKLWASRGNTECGKCAKAVKQGEMVMDCPACMWSLCSGCQPQLSVAAQFWTSSTQRPQPLLTCPEGHDALPSQAAAKAGKPCSRCTKKISRGLASECSQCDWRVCPDCHPIRQCKEGHPLQARPAPPGKCDGCGKRVQMYQAVMDCRQCNWYLCGSCHMPVARPGS